MWNLIFSIFLIIVIWPMLIFAPWVPTRQKDCKRIGELIMKYKFFGKINKNKKIRICDLWSWDWKVLFGLNQFLSKSINSEEFELVWIESSFPFVIFCKIKKFIYFKNYNIKFWLGNFFDCKLDNYNVIYVFWIPHKMHKLVNKLKKECADNTLIISYSFEIDWLELIEKNKPNKDELSIYVYKL